MTSRVNINAKTELLSTVKCNNKTVLLRDTVHQISFGESAAAGLTAVPNHVTWLWQAGDTESFERRITG